MNTEVDVEDHGAIRVLTINRPERRNALSVSTAETLRTELEKADSAADVGAVVLTGADGQFCAGGDADMILDVINDDVDAAPLRLMNAFHRLVEAIWESPLPVVAAVSGVAYGGGFNIALACDLIFCSADARFCQVFLRRGLAPDVGGAYLLPRLVGLQRAKELMLLTPEIDAERAEKMGIVNAVLPDADAASARAIAAATALAEGPTFAAALTKRLINSSTTGNLHSALELEAMTQAIALRSQGVADRFASLRLNRP
ncbi:MAG: enoyl-CoA hydratase/isomerase family protein [Propionibacteriales bacterium]|nr:enoyl-CoA hydratase/isomerase family protein [Propionibacteriales bacterium]